MAKEISLSIDGRTATVAEGTTILQAAETVGIEIPRLCYFAGLPPSGSCRLCLVELEGQGRLAVACTQRVKDGMAVHTRSERVDEARSFVLELIWSTHPGDCTTCEKSGACDLQKYTYDYDVDKHRYPLHVPDGFPTAYDDPLIERDLSLCILCGRCIRACREQSQGILDFMQRGMATAVTTSLDKPLVDSGCDFCGGCVAVCPVGCLVERNRKLRGREWELESSATRCGFCSLGCDLIVDSAHGQIVRTRPGEDGYLCVRGKFGWDYLASDNRLDAPLVRSGGALEETTWEEALARAAKGLADTGSVAGIVGPNVTNEAVKAFGDLVTGSLNGETVALSSGGSSTGVLATFGSLKALADLADLERAKKILAVGPALAEGYPRARLAIKRAVGRGAKLIVIDPGDSELTALATLHLKPPAGSEADVLSAIGKALIMGDLHNADAVEQIRGGADAAARISEQEVPATGIGPGQITEAAKLFAEGKGVLMAAGVPCVAIRRGAALLLLTGRVKGSLLLPYAAANPWSGVLLGADAGLSGIEAKGLVVLGADPAATGSMPSASFLVVQDLFLTETARKADVVLPLRGIAEEEGTVIGAGGKLINVSAAAPSDLPATWQVLADLATAAGKPLPYASLRDVRTAVKDAIASLEGELQFPSLSGAGDPGELRPYGRFELPEPSWVARSQIRGGGVAPGVQGRAEEVAA
ncbi:MAG: (2Fe-2S)-binding protein [Candidatus Bipolaricaulota bacterium]|nr:MAG: (2Fe-2S)-binding protein [Candidatus Bipolaricaulota bacterium]